MPTLKDVKRYVFQISEPKINTDIWISKEENISETSKAITSPL